MLKTLQSGRGLAALAVCAFHLSIAFGDKRYGGAPVFGQFTAFGNLGVDFFFVLSGFIIMFAHERDLGQPQALRTYALKRFIRLYPIYWLYTGIFTALVLMGIGTAATLPAGPVQWISTVSLIRLEAFFTPLRPAWTLFHEVAFYAVFAFLILSRKWGALVFGLWCLGMLLLFQYAPESHRTPVLTYFSAYNLDFPIGMAAYWLFKRAKAWEGWAVLAIGVVALVTCLCLQSAGVVFVGFPLVYGLAFGGILAGATQWEARHPGLKLPVIAFIGDASYTIYLAHESVMGVFMKLFLALAKIAHLPRELVYCLVLVATIGAGCALYKWVEVPLLRFCRSLLLKRPAAV